MTRRRRKTDTAAATPGLPPINAAQEALLAALAAHGPCTRQVLARHACQTCHELGGRLKGLQQRGLVVIDDAGKVALPGQKVAEAWRPDFEREHAERKYLWQTRGIVVVSLGEVQDSYLAQALHMHAVQLYGRRGNAF